MALVYVNPCSMAWGKKEKKREENQRKQEKEKKREKKLLIFLFFSWLFFVYLGSLKNREGNNQCCPILDLKRNQRF